MPTSAEKYGHADMLTVEIEERAAADLLELSDRLGKEEKTAAIGGLIWRTMSTMREAFRTAQRILEGS
jgi:hypothetical protein